MRAQFNAFVERHEVWWELLMGGLAVVYLALGFWAEDASAPAWAAAAETAITVVFVAEFALRFAASYDRGAYLRSHWLDVAALIPTVRQFRLLRLLRLLRLVRTFSSIYRMLLHVERLLGNRQIAGIVVVWLALLVLTSFGLFVAENGVNEAVATPLDALWWGVVTMTTVGYGDVYPITPEGRLAASLLMVLGIGLFGVVTATITGLVVRPTDESTSPSRDPIQRLAGLFELVERGAISEDEYAAKKAELLNRM